MNLASLKVNTLLADLDREDCESSLAHFLRTGWPYIDPAPFVDGWVIDALAEHLEAVCDGEITKLIINIPPRSLKSTMTSVVFPAWVWAQGHRSHTSGPGVKFLHGSYADRLSLRDSVHCRRLIESKWYQGLWGNRFKLSSDQNAKHRFANDQGGERLITSIGAGVTGEGGDIIIIDDPNASNEVESEASIENVLEWWDGTMPTRRNDPKRSAVIIIQQRLAQDDLTGHILEKDVGEWVHCMIPMHYDPDRSFITLPKTENRPDGWKDPRSEKGELLWPERFGPKEVMLLEKDLGPFRSAGQLEQSPVPKGGGIIKREWWKVWPPEGEEMNELGQPVKPVQWPLMDFILATVDTAYTTRTENDYSACAVWGVFSMDTYAQTQRANNRSMVRNAYAEQLPKVMLMDCWQERLPIHELVQKIAKTAKDFKADKVLIENKAAGISVEQELRRLYHSEPWAIQFFDPKSQDKLARMYSVQHLFAEGLVWAPNRPWAEMMISQAENFPKAKHDDLVDTLTMSLRHLRDLGLLQRAVEVREEIQDQMRYTGRPLPPLYPG